MTSSNDPALPAGTGGGSAGEQAGGGRDLTSLIEVARAVRRNNLEELLGAVHARGIQQLVHFTPLPNVLSILQHGLVPRAHAQARQLPRTPVVTDHRRNDNLPEASCLSVTSPNCRMFASKRARFSGDWAVLGFHPEAVLRKPTLFTESNAARAQGLCRDAGIFSKLATVAAFEEMFCGSAAYRESQQLAPNQPTSVQAEILVLDSLEPEALAFVAVQESVPVERQEAIRSALPAGVRWIPATTALYHELFRMRADVRADLALRNLIQAAFQRY